MILERIKSGARWRQGKNGERNHYWKSKNRWQPSNYVVAEIGINHNGDLDCQKLMRAAKTRALMQSSSRSARLKFVFRSSSRADGETPWGYITALSTGTKWSSPRKIISRSIAMPGSLALTGSLPLG